MNRREFINMSLLSSSLMLLPSTAFSKKLRKKHLILLELDGGNDGLNTIIPFKEKNYYKLRPNLAIKKEDCFSLNQSLGLNKNLSTFYKLFKDKDLAVINGLGYDTPNLSHFRSIQIVETASRSDEILNKGWLSDTLLDYQLSLKQPSHGLVLNSRKKGYLFSNDLDILHIKSIEKFLKDTSSFNSSSSVNKNLLLKHLNQQNSLILQARDSFEYYLKDIQITENFSDTKISNSFKEAAKIVKSSLKMPVIKISQKGYDTHSNHVQRHDELLKDLNEAIGSFINELKKDNLFEDVLIVTYSEFGRRVNENASLGLDHGTAAPHFIIGENVRGGIYGKYPSLNNLDSNNLIYTTKFQSLYNTVLSSWFNKPNNLYKSYDKLAFL